MKRSWGTSCTLAYALLGQVVRGFSPLSVSNQRIQQWTFRTFDLLGGRTPALFASIAVDQPLNSTNLEGVLPENEVLSQIPTSETAAPAAAHRTKVVHFNQDLNDIAELCGQPTAQVTRLAQKCQTLFENEKLKDEPRIDTVSFNTVLKAWDRACFSLIESPDHEHMLDSDVPVYTPRDCAMRSLQLLRDETFVDLDSTSYNTVMDTWSKSCAQGSVEQVLSLIDELKQHETLDPDTSSYTHVIETFVYSDIPDRNEKVEEVLDEVERLATQEGSKVKPNTSFYNAILRSYAKEAQKDHSFSNKALALLEKMKSEESPDVRPDTKTYTSVGDTVPTGHTFAIYLADSLFVNQLNRS